jgi:hypothetical protein
LATPVAKGRVIESFYREKGKHGTTIWLNIRCEKGHLVRQGRSNALQNGGCKECSPLRRKSGKEILQSDVREGWQVLDYERKKLTTGSSIWLKLRCDHGHEFWRLHSDRLHYGCQFCSGRDLLTEEKIYSAELRDGYQIVAHERRNKWGGNYLFVKIRCDNGHEYWRHWGKDMATNGCLSCYDDRRSQAYMMSDDMVKETTLLPDGAEWLGFERRPSSAGGSMSLQIYVNYKCQNGHNVWQSRGELREGCGCRFCCRYGFKSDQPALLYLLKLIAMDRYLYKLGVTNRSIEERYPLKADQEIIEDFVTVPFELGEKAHKKEQSFKKKFSQFRYKGDWRMPSGTGAYELFTHDISKMWEYAEATI